VFELFLFFFFLPFFLFFFTPRRPLRVAPPQRHQPARQEKKHRSNNNKTKQNSQKRFAHTHIFPVRCTTLSYCVASSSNSVTFFSFQSALAGLKGRRERCVCVCAWVRVVRSLYTIAGRPLFSPRFYSSLAFVYSLNYFFFLTEAHSHSFFLYFFLFRLL
jgi:hypothetical protein